MIVLICVLFLAYNIVLFYGVESIFSGEVVEKKDVLIVSIVNVGIAAVFYADFTMKLETLSMFLFVVVYVIEFKYIFHRKTLDAIWFTLAYAIFFYAVRLIVMGSIAFCFKRNILSYIDDFSSIVLIDIISFIIVIPLILLFRSIIKDKLLRVLLGSDVHMRFSCGVQGTIYTYMIVNSATLYADELCDKIALTYIKLGAYTIFGCAVAIWYAYFFASQQLNVAALDKLLNVVKDEENKVEQLKNKADRDGLTGVYIREIAIKKIKALLKAKELFYVIFIDIDGLKITNDIFGHEEGDFYITTVADSIRYCFPEDIIARYGGDEFLVVGTYKEGQSEIEKIKTCFDSIEKIAQTYRKQYETSISYGIVTSQESKKLAVEDIVKLADERMYELKKSRKSHRKMIEK